MSEMKTIDLGNYPAVDDLGRIRAIESDNKGNIKIKYVGLPSEITILEAECKDKQITLPPGIKLCKAYMDEDDQYGKK